MGFCMWPSSSGKNPQNSRAPQFFFSQPAPEQDHTAAVKR